MELWIRSQDKGKLIKANNIEISHHYSYKDIQEKYLLPSGSFEYRKVQKKDKYIKSVIMCNDEITLGTYKTKERALEVLDEIQDILKPQQYEVPTERETFTTSPNISNYVYEMPKD